MDSNVYILSLLYAFFNVAGASLIKDKLLHIKIDGFRDFIVFLFDVKVLVAIFLIFISMFFSIKALSLDKFSLVIPVLTGVNFLVTVLVGYVYFKDVLYFSSYLGIVFILVGIYLLGGKA